MTQTAAPLEARPDHGGNLDHACQTYGGARADWIDLSTGINPVAYPVPPLSHMTWSALPDTAAQRALIDAARSFWSVPEEFDLLPTHGASASIAALPGILEGRAVEIPGPTYNEHARAFRAAGWHIASDTDAADVRVLVHPNNPDGRLCSENDLRASSVVIDESFADCRAEYSLLSGADPQRHIILKSFGKFWGLAGARLGFVIAAPSRIAQLKHKLGPWSVSGPALEIGRQALLDTAWAQQTRIRLAEDAQRLDALALRSGLAVHGGTTLFRLYTAADAQAVQHKLAQHRIWVRTFPYDKTWLRLGLPAPHHWPRIEAALAA